MQTEWQQLLKGATVFDGTGQRPRTEDIAIADGKGFWDPMLAAKFAEEVQDSVIWEQVAANVARHYF